MEVKRLFQSMVHGAFYSRESDEKGSRGAIPTARNHGTTENETRVSRNRLGHCSEVYLRRLLPSGNNRL